VTRILALDYGKKRIGLAVSDPLGITAQGIDTLHRTRVRDDLERLRQLAVEREVGMILIGDPKHLDGTPGRASEAVREFGRRLERMAGVPVAYWDERLTSFEAQEHLRATGSRADRRSGAVDRVAAVLLLRDYLEAHPQ